MDTFERQIRKVKGRELNRELVLLACVSILLLSSIGIDDFIKALGASRTTWTVDDVGVHITDRSIDELKASAQPSAYGLNAVEEPCIEHIEADPGWNTGEVASLSFGNNPSSPSASSFHIMCKDHDANWNPINSTTIFSPNDTKAECLTRVSIDNKIEFRCYYRSDSAKSWDYYANWSDSPGPGSYGYSFDINVRGHLPEKNYPRGWKIDVYLDDAYSFSEFFEVTDGGLTQYVMCEGKYAGNSVNVKNTFVIGEDPEAHNFVRLDHNAYFNERTSHCHDYCIIWFAPNGTVYTKYYSSWSDYKDSNPNDNYWGWAYGSDYITINSSTPTGTWIVKLLLDKYYDDGEEWYGPIATTSFQIRPSTLDWPMFHHDQRHAGYSPSPVPKNNETLWSYQTGGVVDSSPAVADGMVFVGSGDYYVYALNQSTGDLIWRYRTGGPIFSSPAVADGMVFIGSNDQYIYALDEFAGTLRWRYRTGGMVVSSPAVAHGKVFVGSFDRSMYSLDEYSGAFINSSALDFAVISSPAVIWLNEAPYVYATRDVFSSPAVADGMVFRGSSEGDISAKDLIGGGLIWKYTTGGGVESSPAVAYDTVFAGSDDGYVYALFTSTGTLKWRYRTGGRVFSSPAIAYDMVFVGSADNRTYALDKSTGVVIWSYETGGSVQSSPAVAHGTVFVGSGDGKIYAFGSINKPPVALFSCNGCNYVSNPIAYVRKSTTFNATESYDPDGSIASYSWDFGDGNVTTVTDPIITHNYNRTGNYTVTLNVTDDRGMWQAAAGNVTVKLKCDLNGDGVVNILDVTIVSRAYNTRPGDPKWNPNVDFDKDGRISILDVAVVSKEYGAKA